MMGFLKRTSKRPWYDYASAPPFRIRGRKELLGREGIRYKRISDADLFCILQATLLSTYSLGEIGFGGGHVNREELIRDAEPILKEIAEHPQLERFPRREELGAHLSARICDELVPGKIALLPFTGCLSSLVDDICRLQFLSGALKRNGYKFARAVQELDWTRQSTYLWLEMLRLYPDDVAYFAPYDSSDRCFPIVSPVLFEGFERYLGPWEALEELCAG